MMDRLPGQSEVSILKLNLVHNCHYIFQVCMERLKISLILWKNDIKTLNWIILQPHCLELYFDYNQLLKMSVIILMQESNELN